MTETNLKKPVQPAKASASLKEVPVANAKEAPEKAPKAPKAWTLNELTRAQRGIKRNQMTARPLSKPVISPAATAAQIKNEK